MWWQWVLGGLIGWTVLAFAAAFVVGRMIWLADRNVRGDVGATLGSTAAVEQPAAAARPVVPRARRRAIPLPRLGLGLVAAAVVLETTGFVNHLNGATGPVARIFAMDAPFSIPQLFVAAVFAAAALTAVAGAGVIPGRRTWWLAVGVVGGSLAALEAADLVPPEALGPRGAAVGSTALALAAGIAASVVAALWFLSRSERRDRRRVLGVLVLYAVAAVALSAMAQAASPNGDRWYAALTYLAESGEALAAVAFLMAVLAGVAPRLVLPADWALRRAADPQLLDLPQPMPAGTAEGHPTS